MTTHYDQTKAIQAMDLPCPSQRGLHYLICLPATARKKRNLLKRITWQTSQRTNVSWMAKLLKGWSKVQPENSLSHEIRALGLESTRALLLPTTEWMSPMGAALFLYVLVMYPNSRCTCLCDCVCVCVWVCVCVSLDRAASWLYSTANVLFLALGSLSALCGAWACLDLSPAVPVPD